MKHNHPFINSMRYAFLAAIIALIFSACGKKGNPTPPPPAKTQMDLLTTGKWNANNVVCTRASDGTTVTLASDDFGGLLLNGISFSGSNFDKSAGSFTSNKANGGYGVDVGVFLTIWFDSSPNVKYEFTITKDITANQLVLDQIGTLPYNHHDGSTETFTRIVVTYGH